MASVSEVGIDGHGPTPVPSSVPAIDFTVETTADVAVVRADWLALEASGRLTPFQRHAWCAPWYNSVSHAGLAEPLIVLVRDARDGAPLALLPLARFRHRLGRVAGFADLDVTDYAGPVLAGPDRLCEQGARAAMVAALAAIDGVDFVKFEKLAPRLGDAANPLFDWRGAKRYPASGFAVDVAVPFEEQVEARFERKFIRNVKRLRRLLVREKGDFRLLRAANAEDKARVYGELVVQRRGRFEEQGATDILDHPVWRKFYADVLQRDPEGRFACIFAIEVGGEVIATEFGLLTDESFLALLPSYRRDGDWRRYGLGQILTIEIIRWCAENGRARYDMTIGDEAYKFDYAPVETALSALMIPVTARGHAVALAWRAKERLRVNPQLFAATKKVLGRLTGRF